MGNAEARKRSESHDAAVPLTQTTADADADADRRNVLSHRRRHAYVSLGKGGLPFPPDALSLRSCIMAVQASDSTGGNRSSDAALRLMIAAAAHTQTHDVGGVGVQNLKLLSRDGRTLFDRNAVPPCGRVEDAGKLPSEQWE